MATLSLPPIDVLATAAAELVSQAAGSKARVNALNKAALMLHEGLTPTLTAGGMLIESRTRNLVHRVDWVAGCGCEAGQAQRPCWHAALVEIVEQAQIHAMPSFIRDRAVYERQAAAQAALDELYV